MVAKYILITLNVGKRKKLNLKLNLNNEQKETIEKKINKRKLKKNENKKIKILNGEFHQSPMNLKLKIC